MELGKYPRQQRWNCYQAVKDFPKHERRLEGVLGEYTTRKAIGKT